MQENLSEIFIKLCSKYSNNHDLIFEYWKEIEGFYSQKSRHYHNLKHLGNMIIELKKVNEKVEDIDSVLFSIFYHDVIYKSTSKDNEERSAEIAKSRLEKINLDKVQIEKIYNQILATKSHNQSNNSDENYLLDLDLSILGKSWVEYQTYTQQIRDEYSIYPNFFIILEGKKFLNIF